MSYVALKRAFFWENNSLKVTLMMPSGLPQGLVTPCKAVTFHGKAITFSRIDLQNLCHVVDQ